MKNIHQNDNQSQNDARLEGEMTAEFEQFKTLSATEQKRVLDLFDRMIAEEAKPEVKAFLIEVKCVFAKYEKAMPGKYKNLTSESRSEILTKISNLAEAEKDEEIKSLFLSVRDFCADLTDEAEESERESIVALEMMERCRAESVADLEEMLKGGK